MTRRGGFTLLEILVALLLLGLAAAATSQAYQAGFRSVAASDDMARATIHARSLLAAAEAGAQGPGEGTAEDGSNWRLDRRAWGGVPAGGRFAPVELTARVTTAEGRIVELHALDWAAR